MEPSAGAAPATSALQGRRSAVELRRQKLEVCRGNAPRSRLYESRASLTTLADRKTGSPGGSCTPDVPKSRAALASGRYKLLVLLLNYGTKSAPGASCTRMTGPAPARPCGHNALDVACLLDSTTSAKRISPELLSAGPRALPRFVRGRLRLTTDCSVRCHRTSAKSELHRRSFRPERNAITRLRYRPKVVDDHGDAPCDACMSSR